MNGRRFDTMNDKLNITIRIANQAPIPLVINRQDEEVIRMAEYNVNRLWTSWSTKFKSKSQMEVLSMVAFRFAELFFTQGQAVKASQDWKNCLKDSLILLDVDSDTRE